MPEPNPGLHKSWIDITWLDVIGKATAANTTSTTSTTISFGAFETDATIHTTKKRSSSYAEGKKNKNRQKPQVSPQIDTRIYSLQ